jgi:hypothetical protein
VTPKTAAGCRAVALDKHTVTILRANRSRQLAQRDKRHAAGQVWTESGYVFTRKDGLPINPNYATTRFRKLTDRASLPPVRLHDLRHGAASLAHEAGADLKTLQDLLGHSSIVVTADTYTSVLPRRPAPLRRRHRRPGAGRRPAHPQTDQAEGGEEPAHRRDEKQTTPGQQPHQTKRSRRTRRRRHPRRHAR